jgi:hypothetical protein
MSSLSSLKGNLDLQNQTEIQILPLEEYTTESKVTGQASQKKGSWTFDRWGGNVDGTMDGTMTCTHPVPKCEHSTVQASLPCLSNLTTS